MNKQFLSLRVFAVMLKVLSVLSVAVGLILDGLLIYAWGRLTALYDVLRTALDFLMESWQTLGGDEVFISELPRMPIWPLLVILALALGGMAVTALALWAAGEWLDMRLALAKDESEARVLQAKMLNAMAGELTVISGHISSLALGQNVARQPESPLARP